MKILFICHRIPYPPNKGEKIRAYHTLKYLCSRHEVHLAFLVDDKTDLNHIETLRPMVKSLHYDFINPKLKKLRSGAALLMKKPISVSYFYSASLQREIDTVLKLEDIDCILCSSSPTAEYVLKSKLMAHTKNETPSTQSSVLSPQSSALNQSSVLSPQSSCSSSKHPRLLMDFIDMDSDKWRQYAENSSLPMRWVYNHEATYLLKYESNVAARFHHALFTSEAEKNLFLSHFAADNIHTMGNGVDVKYFNPNHQSPLKKNGRGLMFTGMMDYLPNIEGVTWFTQKILPKVQERFSDLTFYIVGNRPTPEVRHLARKKGVVVTGFVEDIRDYLAMADICIAPLRIARGIQNKVLEAMAMGKPTVCTPEALTGIPATPESEIAVASDENAFAEQIVRLLANPEEADLLGKKARGFIEQNASWEAKLSTLDKLIA